VRRRRLTKRVDHITSLHCGPRDPAAPGGRIDRRCRVRGETTVTIVAGGCPYTAAGFSLHTSYAGAQLDAAVAFLAAHRGRVSPITLSIGNNDAVSFFRSCNFDITCVTAGLSRFTATLQPRRRAQHIAGGRARCGDYGPGRVIA